MLQLPSEALVTTQRPSERKRPCRRRGGFTAVELIVVCLIIVVLIALLLPAIGSMGHDRSGIRCASNLRNIATHAFIYSNADVRNGGRFPRTFHDPAAGLDRSLAGNVAGTKSFDPQNPAATPVGVNNTQAAFYLLMKSTDLTGEIFNCPQGESKRAYEGQDLTAYANWPAQYAAYNSYSYNCPYPTAAAVTGGWKFDNSLGPDYPLVADINPGSSPAGGPTAVAYTDGRKAMRQGNSPNHWFEGQQVAYCDVHVEWQTSPFAGVQREGVPYRDNIYTSTAGGVDAAGKGGTVWAPPQDAADAVLLPTAQDSPGTAIAARTPDMLGPPSDGPNPFGALALPAVVGVAALVLWFVVRRNAKRRKGTVVPPHAGV
jgi:hypothetical protein